jgi:N6-adenosine-specific RNA methylase IME4
MDRTGRVSAPFREFLKLRDEQRVSKLKPALRKYRTLVIDPPWKYKDSVAGRTKPPYATMSQDELLGLPVTNWAEGNCHLYLWATNARIKEALELVAAWGFEQKTILTWHKDKWGLGLYFRNQTEHVIFCVKGKLATRSNSLSTVFHGPLGDDSEKPDEFYDLVRRASFPPFGEAFQRKPRPGFVNLFRAVGKTAGQAGTRTRLAR